VDFGRADALNRAIRLVGMKHRGQASVELARLGLHTGQEVLMLELDANGPRTQTELAFALGCEPPSVTLMVQKLEAAGLIKRSRSTRDGRATVVELAGPGRALMPELKEVWLHLAETTVAGLDATSLDGVLQVLDDLVDSLYAGRAAGWRRPADGAGA
jgi:DNA-binding MarR family transcriptional regulator